MQSIKRKIDSFTMCPRVWLIGDRSTEREKETRCLNELVTEEWIRASNSHRKNADLKRDQLAIAIKERDEAREAGIEAMSDRNS